MASNKWLDVAALIEAAGSLLWPAVALHGALAFVLGRTWFGAMSVGKK
jgi:hypothetical protein